jgi:hypothetical protein
MNCSLNTVYIYVSLAVALLVAASVATFFWVTAFPLFLAAAAVAAVAYVLIPAIKNALLQYAACRGPTGKCQPPTQAIDTLGQAAASLSVFTFLLAAAIQIAALAFLQSIVLAFLGPPLELAVLKLVWSGRIGCWVAIALLIGVLINALGFASCMDSQQDAGSRGLV